MAQDPVATAASNNPMLTTLTSALSGKLNPNVNLIDTLNNGQYTVFAPTDAAFAKVPKATLAALKHNRAKLRAVLLYHVLQGKLTAAKLVELHSVKTLNGQSLKIRVSDGNVTIGGARIVKSDIAASNGVIHVIDRVLIPR